MSSDHLSVTSLSRLNLTGDSTQPPRSFPHFIHLPKEIRLSIWEHALSEPRIVHLESKLGQLREYWRVWSNKAADDIVGFCEYDKIHTPATESWEDMYGFLGPSLPVGFKSKTPLPVNVCQELHQVVAKKYSKAFGTQHCPPMTWFDFKNDALFLDCVPDIMSEMDGGNLICFNLFDLSEADRNSTEKLVLQFQPSKVRTQQTFPPKGTILAFLRAFRNLKGLLIISYDIESNLPPDKSPWLKAFDMNDEDKNEEQREFERELHDFCSNIRQRESSNWKIPRISYWSE
jgi:hypothetical protein